MYYEEYFFVQSCNNRVHGSKETIHYYFIKCPRMHEAGRGGAGGDGVERGFEDSNSTFLRKSVR